LEGWRIDALPSRTTGAQLLKPNLTFAQAWGSRPKTERACVADQDEAWLPFVQHPIAFRETHHPSFIPGPFPILRGVFDAILPSIKPANEITSVL
jgi:hypothetical protein